MSFDPPNYTQIPNVLFDIHVPRMKEAELRVTLAIARKTFGWHKKKDKLSLSQLMKLTGLSRQGVLNGIEAGIGRNTIHREPAGQSFYYSLVVNEVDQQVVNEVDQQVVNEVDTQKKLLKKGVKKGAVVSDNTRKDISSNEEKPTNQPPDNARGDLPNAETNNGRLVGSSVEEELKLEDSDSNCDNDQPVEERAPEPSHARESEDLSRAAGASESAMIALLDDPQVKIGDARAREDLLRAGGDLEGLLYLVGYTFDQDKLGKVAIGFGNFLVGLARNGYESNREFSDAFARSDIFARHAPEGIRAEIESVYAGNLAQMQDFDKVLAADIAQKAREEAALIARVGEAGSRRRLAHEAICEAMRLDANQVGWGVDVDGSQVHIIDTGLHETHVRAAQNNLERNIRIFWRTEEQPELVIA